MSAPGPLKQVSPGSLQAQVLQSTRPGDSVLWSWVWLMTVSPIRVETPLGQKHCL